MKPRSIIEKNRRLRQAPPTTKEDAKRLNEERQKTLKRGK